MAGLRGILGALFYRAPNLPEDHILDEYRGRAPLLVASLWLSLPLEQLAAKMSLRWCQVLELVQGMLWRLPLHWSLLEMRKSQCLVDPVHWVVVSFPQLGHWVVENASGILASVLAAVRGLRPRAVLAPAVQSI